MSDTACQSSVGDFKLVCNLNAQCGSTHCGCGRSCAELCQRATADKDCSSLMYTAAVQGDKLCLGGHLFMTVFNH